MYFVDVNVTLFEVFVPENFTQLPFLRMMSTLQEKEISGLTFRQTMATKSTCVIYQAFVLIFVIPEIPWQILTTDIPTFLRRLLCRIWSYRQYMCLSQGNRFQLIIFLISINCQLDHVHWIKIVRRIYITSDNQTLRENLNVEKYPTAIMKKCIKKNFFF